MTNQNLYQHGAQTTSLGVMIGSQHRRPDQPPANVGCPFSKYTNNSSFRYTNDEQIHHSHQIPRHRKLTREDNKLALYCCFRSSPDKRGYRKNMIEIWTEFGRFKATNQILADLVRTIIKNGWFSGLEILEIHQQIFRQTHQQTPITVTETINTGKPETPNQTLHNNDSFIANTQTQTLTQETNVDTIKRIV